MVHSSIEDRKLSVRSKFLFFFFFGGGVEVVYGGGQQ